MAFTIREIATALGAQAEGNLDLTIARAAEPQSAGPEDLAMAMDPKYAEGLAKGTAKAALLWPGADWAGLGLQAAIFVPRSRLAMAGLSRMLDSGPGIAPGIHPSAVIDPTAQIGAEAAIGPFVVIGAGVKIGPRARIASHVAISDGVTIGSDVLLMAGVKIGGHVTIGDRFIGNLGCVVGGDGFSFVTPEKSGVEEIRSTLSQRAEIRPQSWTRIHSLGSVTLGDDVELGANSTIDRGTIRDTFIGRGTKIDNLVQIGHNAIIGEDCMICGQAGVAGSSRVGNRVVLSGKVGINDNIFVGDDVIAAGGANVFTNVPAGRVVLGNPAVKMETQLEINKAIRRLPRLAATVAELQKLVSKL
ncbi:UDP-3-O-(3-hydroxymyristoyl)glucosamine N-acyltransferase [Gemmobacter serpentinus]|uniref:UDP-3-O-(3-hydroxymyristoyl)glucosamine N-acyltransferase n=1 Tax=Gemmobacter serpentinus TaxID=2652247 RepID=UPI00124D0EE6|nr:UDP-3-O-(3-hydroxymyristoyl)glucosamine N-acyltransferase [Gemmobacter serpentinus]